MKIPGTIEVKYKATADAATAKAWLEGLPSLFSADFEAAVKYSDEEIAEAKEKAEDKDLPRKQRIPYQAIAKATPLGHPSHTVITHLSTAWSKEDGLVIILDSEETTKIVLDFLVNTDKTQVWHNYGYDGKLIRYFTKKDAKNIEDSQIRAKCLMNHVDVHKANTRLKGLMGSYYGDWGIDESLFHTSQKFEEKVLRYSATDACATYLLWEQLDDFTRTP